MSASHKQLEELRKKILDIENGLGSTDSAVSCQKRKNKDSMDKSSMDDCYTRILSLITPREKCEKELRQRLVDVEGFEEKAFGLAIDKAKMYGLIDDLRYAEIYTRSKLAKGYGTRVISNHLENMGIDYFASDEIVLALDSAKDSEYELAWNFIKTHPSKSKNLKEGTYRKLINRGYSNDVALNVAYEYSRKIESNK